MEYELAEDDEDVLVTEAGMKRVMMMPKSKKLGDFMVRMIGRSLYLMM